MIPIFKLGAYEQILTLKALDSFMIMEPYDLNNEQKLSLVALETILPTQANTGVSWAPLLVDKYCKENKYS